MQFFNQALILGKADQKLSISRKVYDLIYELNHICPRILLTVLPQLEFKLKSTEESERMGSVSLLARMFSEKGSTLADKHRQLWLAFLGRYNDISLTIRIKCVQYTMHFLLNHPELLEDITETLKLRQHDSEENVRYEVVMAIVSTAKRDFEIVSNSEELLNFVKERTLDKKFKIRKEANSGLAMIYKKHLSDPQNVPEATKKAVTWIKDKILHGYYMPGMEDRLLVERLVNTCLVPFNLNSADRMKKLFMLFGTIDENASKAFIEVRCQIVAPFVHVRSRSLLFLAGPEEPAPCPQVRDRASSVAPCGRQERGGDQEEDPRHRQASPGGGQGHRVHPEAEPAHVAGREHAGADGEGGQPGTVLRRLHAGSGESWIVSL